MFDRFDICPEGQGEINIINAEEGDWILFEEVKHLLERSDNNEYAVALKIFHEWLADHSLDKPKFGVWLIERLNSQP